MITVAALGLRLVLPRSIAADRPLLILFVIPMLVSAYLGGAGPGLLSTTLVALGTVLLLFSPGYGFAFTRPLNLAQWVILLATGLLVSVLCEALHRARRRAEQIAREHQEAARALHESQELLQAISDNSTAVIYAKDLAGRYLMVNRRYSEVFHVRPEAVLGRTDHDIFPKAAADAFRAMDERVAAAGRALTEEEVAPHEDGPHTYVSMKSPLRDAAGIIYGIFGISTDITERKRVEDALRSSEERMRSIIETALDAVITIDTTGAITGWSPQAETTFGWSVGEALGRSLAQTIIPEKYRDAHTRGMQRFLATGEAAVLNRRVELSAKHRDGREFPVELAITPIRLDGKLSFSAFVRDITERHQAKAALEASEHQYRLIFEESPLPKWIYDLESLQFLAVNKAAQAHYGYSEGEFLQMTIREIRPPEDLPALEEDVAHARGHGSLSGEWRHRKRDGSIIQVIVSAHDIQLRGRTARLVVAQDITERKRAEEELRTSEERFRKLAESLPQLIWTCRADGWCDYLSRQWVEYTGRPAEEQLGDGWAEHLHPEDRARVQVEWEQATKRGDLFDVEFRIRRADGAYRWFKARAVPLRDGTGRIVKWFGSNTDIENNKHSEHKLQTQLSWLNLLHRITRAIGERQDLESIFQVVVRSLEDNLPIDLCCMCLYDATDHLLTVTRVGVHSGALATELALTEQAKIPIDENGLARCVRGQLVHEPDIVDVKFPFPQRLARAGLRALLFAPLLVESKVFGVFIGARRLANSFSSGECEFLKQLSEHTALAANQAQLYGALQRAYDDLRQTQQAIMQQERLRALGQMASGIAHDINNAISPAALYAESLLEKESSLSAKAREQLAVIQHALEDVAQTVARMREFYRQREPQLQLAAVDLNRLVPQVIELSRARWHDMPLQRGIVIELQTDLAPNLPAIMGVESEIREALINLVFNAVDAMPEGGALTLRTRLLAGSPSHSAVEVVDTGVGMDGDTRRRCMEPFFTTKGERGTGLGLAMVYGMVQRHSADIQIESAVGHGTTVRLSFAIPEKVATPAQAISQASLHARLRLLIVDDDPLLIKSLRDTLEADGHVIVTANDGRSGIDAFRAALARKESFAAVITDLGMPYVDGRRVASEIKAASPNTPVIMLTGWGQRLAAEGDVPPHVDRVLAKPPKLRELRDALAQCCPS